MQVPEIRLLSDFHGCVDFGLISFREDEFDAVLRRFPPQWLIIDGERQYNITRIIDRLGKAFYVATVRTVEQGHRDAQSTAASLIRDLEPSWIVLVGIAGAKPEQEFCLGDVIVGTRVHDFSVTANLPDARTETAIGSDPAHPLVSTVIANLRASKGLLGNWNSEAAIGQKLPAVSRADEDFYGDLGWKDKVRKSLAIRFPAQGRIRRPLVTAATIGSGLTLMKDPAEFKKWLEFARDLKAVEMEAPGVFSAAASVKGSTPVLAIRGVSDLVGYNRDSAWTSFACNSAASFCLSLLTSGAINITPKKKPPLRPSSVPSNQAHSLGGRRRGTSTRLKRDGGGQSELDEGAAPGAIEAMASLDQRLLELLKRSPEKRPSILLHDESGSPVGVLLKVGEYELLRAAAAFVLNSGMIGSLLHTDSKHTTSFEAAFKMGERAGAKKP